MKPIPFCILWVAVIYMVLGPMALRTQAGDPVQGSPAVRVTPVNISPTGKIWSPMKTVYQYMFRISDQQWDKFGDNMYNGAILDHPCSNHPSYDKTPGTFYRDSYDDDDSIRFNFECLFKLPIVIPDKVPIPSVLMDIIGKAHASFVFGRLQVEDRMIPVFGMEKYNEDNGVVSITFGAVYYDYKEGVRAANLVEYYQPLFYEMWPEKIEYCDIWTPEYGDCEEDVRLEFSTCLTNLGILGVGAELGLIISLLVCIGCMGIVTTGNGILISIVCAACLSSLGTSLAAIAALAGALAIAFNNFHSAMQCCCNHAHRQLEGRDYDYSRCTFDCPMI